MIRLIRISLLSVVFFLFMLNQSHSWKEVIPESGVLDEESKIIWFEADLFGIQGKGWDDKEIKYGRLPLRAKELVREAVWDLGHCTAGLSVTFWTDSDSLMIRWSLLNPELDMPHMPATGVSGIDLYGKDQSDEYRFIGNGRPFYKENETLFVTYGFKEFLLYFPLYNGVMDMQIGIPATGKIMKEENVSDKKSIVFYGTSITQGGCVSRPGLAVPAIVSRKLDIPVINLGFSGNGRMEPEMADLLGELNPSLYVLDCLWNMTPELIKMNYKSFIRKIKKAQPLTAVLLVEDSNYKNLPSEKGLITYGIFHQLKKEGMKNLYYLSNSNMLGDDWEGTVDGCHPNDLGMMRQGKIFVEYIRFILKNTNYHE